MSIEKAYNSWAEQYDTNENKTRDLDVKSTIATLSKYEFKNVIELGCGTGKNTQWLAKRAEKVIGIDFSHEMLRIAKNKIVDSRIEFIKADLTKKWDVENHSADLITSSLTLEHIEDLNHIFDQSNQKLIDDGILFISELHPFKQYNGSKARYESESGLVELECYTHHITDYIDYAMINGFKLIEMKEWFDDVNKKSIPRLISLVFRKKN